MAETLHAPYSPLIEAPDQVIDLEFGFLTSGLEGIGRMAVASEAKAETAPARITGEANRRNHLENLASAGFESFAEHGKVIDQIASVGLPVDNYNSLTLRPNARGREGVVGSWRQDMGNFSVYEAMYNTSHQERLATIAHEGFHAVSPLIESNDRLYSSPEAREKAEVHVKAVADQSLRTGIHIDGYHQRLMHQYKAGEIDLETFQEETGAIMAEKALAGNRALLTDVQERQYRKMEDLAREARVQGKPELPSKVALISGDDLRHKAQGIDATLIDLLDSVSSLEELVAHTKGLKDKFYPREDIAKASERGAANDPDKTIGGIVVLRFVDTPYFTKYKKAARLAA